MKTVDRRLFLALSSALMLDGAAAQDHVPPPLSPPRPDTRVPSSWIKAEKIPLWPTDAPGASRFKGLPDPPDAAPIFLHNVLKPDLHVFRPSHPDGRALLVLPGGAYRFVSIANEGAAVAARLCPKGITLFVLTYRLPGEGWEQPADVPLQDAQRAMRLIRSHERYFSINPDTLSVLGFSAGGHLAATLATQHAEHTYAPIDAVDSLSPRPFAAALIYPVVTMVSPWTHEMSRTLLLGPHPSEEAIRRRSAELHVDKSTPPAFAAHAMDDPAVPVENTLNFITAMRSAKRPIEAHLLQEGGHAFGVGWPNTPSALWPDLFNLWLNRLI